MNDPRLPSEPDSGEESQLPEVRLELTQAGVRQVLSLYAEEQAGRSGQGGMQIGFDDILRAIVARKGLVAACVLAGGLLGALVLQIATPLYAVTAEVVLDHQDSLESALNAGRGGSAFIATQAEIMQSRSVISDAVASVGAPEDLEDGDPVVGALEWLQASPVSGTQVVALSYLGPDPEYGARLLGATVAAYRERLKADEQQNQAQRLRVKEAEYEALIDEVRRLDSRLNELRRQHFGGASAADAVEAQNQVIRDQTQRLAEVRQQRIALENQLLAGSAGMRTDDPVTRSLQDRLFQSEAELARVTQTLKPDHPTRAAAEREVTLLRRQLANAQQATPRALAREIEAAKGVEAELANVLEAEQARLADAERLRRDELLVVDELEQTQALIEERRRALLDQRLLSRLADSGEVGVTARLIAEPVQPLAPTWPNTLLVLAIGIGGGLLVGTCWAVVDTRRQLHGWQSAERKAFERSLRV